MFNKSDIARDECQLTGKLKGNGYDWWWHSFTAISSKTGKEKQFFIEFFLCNPELGAEHPILGQSELSKREEAKPSYLMIKAGAWGENKAQLHRFFGWKKIEVNFKKPFSIKADDCFLNEDETHGHIEISEKDAKEHPEWMSDFGEISWDLKIEKDIAFNVGYGAGRLFRALKLFEMFWHVEGMKTYFEGKITYNGEDYVVKRNKSFGYADKNWGKDFTSPWVWLSSNNLVSKRSGKRLTNSVFDIGGGCPKVGPIALKRKLLSAFYYEGKQYEFNFSKFWSRTRTKFECKETDNLIIWHVEQKTWRNRVVVDITCKKKDMLLVNYEAPNGKKLHNRLWNGGNGEGTILLYHDKELIDEIYAKNVGCEYGEYDR